MVENMIQKLIEDIRKSWKTLTNNRKDDKNNINSRK